MFLTIGIDSFHEGFQCVISYKMYVLIRFWNPKSAFTLLFDVCFYVYEIVSYWKFKNVKWLNAGLDR